MRKAKTIKKGRKPNYLREFKWVIPAFLVSFLMMIGFWYLSEYIVFRCVFILSVFASVYGFYAAFFVRDLITSNDLEVIKGSLLGFLLVTALMLAVLLSPDMIVMKCMSCFYYVFLFTFCLTFVFCMLFKRRCM